MAAHTAGKERDAVLVAIGRQIRSLREARKVAQEEFAVQAGMDRSYYGGVERGERNLSALNLVRIALALGVEAGQLFPPPSVLAELQSKTASGGRTV